MGLTSGEVVPNAPCGVESIMIKKHLSLIHQFLMHRVELKVWTVLPVDDLPTRRVPNAPCGVESGHFLRRTQYKEMFLMHRVELKDGGKGWMKEKGRAEGS